MESTGDLEEKGEEMLPRQEGQEPQWLNSQREDPPEWSKQFNLRMGNSVLLDCINLAHLVISDKADI